MLAALGNLSKLNCARLHDISVLFTCLLVYLFTKKRWTTKNYALFQPTNSFKQLLISEIFYSLQGEGFFTGTPAVFVRFSGCNLRCPFCDTNHKAFVRMSEEEIVEAVCRFPARHVVLTGGEPSLQVTPRLVDLLHMANRFVAMETNGTCPVDSLSLDWVTLSPKHYFLGKIAAPAVLRPNELKLVFSPEAFAAAHTDPEVIAATFQTTHLFLQPCDTGDETKNRLLLQQAVEYCKSHPHWRLSLQTHKYIGIE